MARLVDVAKAAGVSRSTVSNVFNNPEIVRPELRTRVREAAAELGYLGPDPRGRLLRDGRFNAIAVMPARAWGVLDCLRNPVFEQFLSGVAGVCDENETHLLLASGRSSDRGIRTALVDGFIFGRVEYTREIEAARMRRLPFAVVDFDPGPDVFAVQVDSRAGCYAAARHLVELGHRRFGIVAFGRSSSPAVPIPTGGGRERAIEIAMDRKKYRGYADALAEAGIDIADVPMVQADPWDSAAAGMMLDLAPEATAILSMSVMQALAVLEEAKRRGIAVPSDLSVIGFNDLPDAARADPPLTTVDGMMLEKGQTAAQMVFDGGRPRHETLIPGLILRASTGPAPTR